LLKQKALKGFIWTGLSNAITQGIKFFSRIILARILLPEDFGLVAIGLFIIGGFSLLQGLGITTSLVQKKGDIEEAAGTGVFLSVIIGLFLFIPTFFLAGPIANFFHKPEALGVVRVLSLTFIINAFELVPSALLCKEIEFKKKFIPEVSSAIIYGAVSIISSMLGFGYWSLIYGYLSSTLVSAVLMWIVCDFRPKLKFNQKVALELINYGKFVAGNSVLAFLVIQCDNAFVKKLLGIAALGYYTMAYTIANLPITGIAFAFAGTMFPVFSKLQDKTAQLKNVFVKSLKILMIVILPISCGIIILADQFIITILGAKWLPMAAAMKVLSIFAIFRVIRCLTGTLLQAIGQAKVEFINAIFELLIMITLIIPLTLKYGIVGTSITVSIMFFAGFMWLLIKTKKIILLHRSDYIDIFSAPIFSTLIMFSFTFTLKSLFFSVNNIFNLIFLSIFSLAAYSLALFILDRKIFTEYRSLFKLATS